MPSFIIEARKRNGQPYPTETMWDLLMAIQVYLSHQGNPYQFMKDEAFTTLKNTLDNRMKELSAQGIRRERRQAEVCSCSYIINTRVQGTAMNDHPDAVALTDQIDEGALDPEKDEGQYYYPSTASHSYDHLSNLVVENSSANYPPCVNLVQFRYYPLSVVKHYVCFILN